PCASSISGTPVMADAAYTILMASITTCKVVPQSASERVGLDAHHRRRALHIPARPAMRERLGTPGVEPGRDRQAGRHLSYPSRVDACTRRVGAATTSQDGAPHDVADAGRRTDPPSTSEATGHGRQPRSGYRPTGADAGCG